jgi:hypothetical protein
MSLRRSIRKPQIKGFPFMLVGYMRVSSDCDRETTDRGLQIALLCPVLASPRFSNPRFKNT